MARGGRRQGAGRKVGASTKRTREIANKAMAEGLTPLEFMLNVLRDEKNDFKDRYAAAVDAAPYLHPKLAAVEHSGNQDSPVALSIVSGVPREAHDDDHSHVNGADATH